MCLLTVILVNTVVKPNAFEQSMFACALIKLYGYVFVSMHHPILQYSFMLFHHAFEYMFVFMLIISIFILILIVMLSLALVVILLIVLIHMGDLSVSTDACVMLVFATIRINWAALQS